MKSTKILWSVIVCLVLSLSVSILANIGIINLSTVFKSSITTENVEKVLQLSDIEMTLDREWSLPKGSVVVKLDFKVKNISKEHQTIYQTNLSIFDYNDCRYDVSTTFYSKRNPLQFSETLNPNNQKELSVIFEVPQNELYCVGFSNNIDCVGKQIFVDKIRNIKCEYETFKEMINVRDSLLKQPSKYKKEPKKKVKKIIPEVVFTEPEKSVYESLTKKGTNPDEEIKVDLNDFLGTLDDGTDWNYTELSETDCKVLARQKIYYSENKGAWVKVKPSNDDTSALERQKRMEIAEKEMKEQPTCNISFDLQGRQVKQIPTVANSGSISGNVILKIEVSPVGEVVKCDIDNRSIVKDTEIRQQCVEAALKTEFNAINSKRNQFGMMRFNFRTNK